MEAQRRKAGQMESPCLRQRRPVGHVSSVPPFSCHLANVFYSATHQASFNCSLHSVCIEEQNDDHRISQKMNSFYSYCVTCRLSRLFCFLISWILDFPLVVRGLQLSRKKLMEPSREFSPSESLSCVSVCVSLTPLASGSLQPSSDAGFIRRAAPSRDSKQTD